MHLRALHLTEIGALSMIIYYKSLRGNQYDSTLKREKYKKEGMEEENEIMGKERNRENGTKNRGTM
jgi:hypothetical protein